MSTRCWASSKKARRGGGGSSGVQLFGARIHLFLLMMKNIYIAHRTCTVSSRPRALSDRTDITWYILSYQYESNTWYVTRGGLVDARQLCAVRTEYEYQVICCKFSLWPTNREHGTASQRYSSITLYAVNQVRTIVR